MSRLSKRNNAEKRNREKHREKRMGKAKIILYHGTRAPLEKIAKEGLLIRAGRVGPDTKLQMIDEVLDEFGFQRDQVPGWIWKGEYNYEATIVPHLHFAVNRDVAAGYSRQGCEIQAQVRAAMYMWLTGPDLTFWEITQKLGRNPYHLAAEKNGKTSLVFEVEIPRTFVRAKDLLDLGETASKFRTFYGEDKVKNFLATTTFEMRVIRNILPEMITKVWRIGFPTPYGRDYQFEEVPLNGAKEE